MSNQDVVRKWAAQADKDRARRNREKKALRKDLRKGGCATLIVSALIIVALVVFLVSLI